MIPVENDMVKDLQEAWDTKGEYSGYFNFRNIQNGRSNYFDINIFIKDIADEQTFNDLVKMNNTEEGDNRMTFPVMKQHISGFIRIISFTSHDENNSPMFPEQNRAIFIYEGQFSEGKLAKDPETFGRKFLTDSKCYIGYQTYDTNEKDFLLYGKGMIISGIDNDIVSEGLYRFSNDDPQVDQEIEDFKVNLKPL